MSKNTISDEDLELIAKEIEDQFTHLDDEEWYKVVKILSQRIN